MTTLNTVNNFMASCALTKVNWMKRSSYFIETLLGSDHTSTLRTLDNLDVLCIKQGKLDEAEKFLQRALNGYEKASRDDFAPLLEVVEHSGMLHARKKEMNESMKMYLRAL